MLNGIIILLSILTCQTSKKLGVGIFMMILSFDKSVKVFVHGFRQICCGPFFKKSKMGCLRDLGISITLYCFWFNKALGWSNEYALLIFDTVYCTLGFFDMVF